MTLAVAFKGPEGLVLAADSRLTLTASLATGEQVVSYFDNATKLVGIEGQPYAGVLTYGLGAIGTSQPRSVLGFISEFETKLAAEHDARKKDGARLKVVDIARKLGEFYSEQWQKAAMPADSSPIFFLVAGFDEGEAYGRIYGITVPSALEPVAYCADYFGVRWGGESELANRLINGFDPRASTVAKDQLKLTNAQVQGLEKKWTQELELSFPYQFLPLQDCVDLATFLVTMTSAVQSWTLVGSRGVGGAVDVATITRSQGFQAVKQKRIEVREWH
jgi:hypothetical protein